MLFVIFPWHFEYINHHHDHDHDHDHHHHHHQYRKEIEGAVYHDEVWVAPFDGLFEISSTIFENCHHFWIDGQKIEPEPWLETKLVSVGQSKCLYEFFIENVGHKMTISNRDILVFILERKIRIKRHGFKTVDVWKSYVGGHQMFKWATWRRPSVPLFFE